MKRRIAGAMTAGLVIVGVLMAGAVPSGAATTTRRITVVGTGQVKGTPDVADVTIGVTARGKTAAEALDTANDRAAKVIQALKDAGVSDDDLQTSGLSIQPTYADDNTITGYEVSNMVSARLRDIAKTGAILDATARVAGDEIRLQGISFSIDDDSALLATARARAVKRARAQADQLADAAGVSVGQVVSIDEGSVAIPYDYRAADASGAAASSVPVEPGTQTLSIQVSVVYSIA
ncbi:MAG TPA: SIMPL domain-containing protein [Acidimicrobiia bacterium]|nr:SIMPL domain-containing protein [Acidimicrobiia bacterium]